MNKWIMVLGFVVLVSGQIRADDAFGKIQLAEKLAKVLGLNDNIGRSWEQIVLLSEQLIDSRELNAIQKEEVKRKSKERMNLIFQSVRDKNWARRFAEIYAAELTREELVALIDFYQTPVGRKFIQKQPKLTLSVLKTLQDEVAPIMPRMEQAIKDSIEEVKNNR